MKKKITCVVEIINGRILIFADSDMRDMVDGIRGVMDIFPVKIYDESASLINEVSSILENCEEFAIISNKKEVEKNMGRMLVEMLGKKVNLETPDCIIRVEKRGKYYILFE